MWNNIPRLLDHLRATGREGAVITRRCNVSWLTGADTHVVRSMTQGVCRLHVSPRELVVETDRIEHHRLRDEEFGSEWRFQVREWFEPAPPVPEGWVSDELDDFCQPLRASLSQAEQAYVRTLGRECAEVMAREMKGVRRGLSEHELAGRIVGSLRARGIFTPVMLVAADDRIRSYRHPIPTDRTIERAVMAAICAERRGLIVSITRLVHFGPIDADLDARHRACQAVNRTYHDATRPGERWCDILRRGIDTYAARGFDGEWKLHHQGGPMGYAARDFIVTPDQTQTVQPHQLVGWNPSVTGTKCEDTILSTGEVLTEMNDWPKSDGQADILVL